VSFFVTFPYVFIMYLNWVHLIQNSLSSSSPYSKQFHLISLLFFLTHI
jgi:hypothetical protein